MVAWGEVWVLMTRCTSGQRSIAIKGYIQLWGWRPQGLLPIFKWGLLRIFTELVLRTTSLTDMVLTRWSDIIIEPLTVKGFSERSSGIFTGGVSMPFGMNGESLKKSIRKRIWMPLRHIPLPSLLLFIKRLWALSASLYTI